jgi:uncharacterized protein (TIRG00374 family)
MLLVGFGVLVVVIQSVDLTAVWHQLEQLGWVGLFIVLAISPIWHINDTIAWMLTFRSIKPSFPWFRRLFGVHIVGDALNNVTPFASLGGEPVKAVLLKNNHGIEVRETTATLLMAHTVIVCALVIFLIIGVALMFNVPSLPESYRVIAGVALTTLILLVVSLLLIQRYRFVSRVGRWLSHSWLGARALRAVDHIREVEGHLISFYSETPERFAAALLLQFWNWCMGAVEIYLVLWFLGHPIGFTDAWVVEASVVLVRNALLFVPASIGAQEGTFLLVCGAITGVPAVAVAVALIRRLRELTWIVIGIAMGGCLTFARASTPRPKSDMDSEAASPKSIGSVHTGE